ncbi:nuclear transport factor 2 family protein [Gammaproteobacteria bacterium]|nr:nuclear transport factor 2 family protein [Gammaproteobacteria bacterium]
MSDHSQKFLSDAADTTAITQLIIRERESRDLCFWDRMLDCFHSDSRVNITWFQGTGPDFVEASKGMVERGMLAKHRLGPILVTLNTDRAVASLSAIIDVPTLIDDVELMLSAHCLMFYGVEKRANNWRIASFEGIYRRDEFTPAILGQTVAIPADIIKNFRPSYRNLSYSLHLHGYAVDPDLPGEDRPESVQKATKALFQWAGIEPPH